MASAFRALSPGGKSILVGVPAIVTMYYAFFNGLQRQQHAKNTSDSLGDVPTWQYRLGQAQNPVEHADNPATLRSEVLGAPGSATGLKTKADPEPSFGSAGAPIRGVADGIMKAAYPAGQQENAGSEKDGHIDGKTAQPVQKAPGKEGLAYTKRQDYVDNYDEHEKK